MDNRSGNIIFPDEFDKLKNEAALDENKKLFDKLYTLMEEEPTEKQLTRKPPRVGPNEPCPCGSRKKFKKCHWLKEK